MKKFKTAMAVTGSVLAIAGILLVDSCALHPLAWQPEPKPLFTSTLLLNEKLSVTEKVSLNGWFGPEDILFDSDGKYTIDK